MNEPVITAGPVATPVLRTGVQALSPALIIQGLQVFDLWHPSADQTQWLMVIGPILLALGQNLIERWKGRKLIGVDPSMIERITNA